MPMITQQGALNTTALVVPDLYVQIVPPQVLNLNGVPTNVAGVVGTAQWGPINQPVTIGTMQNYAVTFGAIQVRKYDMGTIVATAVQQGAQAFVCVRVTDGTDAAATGTLGTTFLTLTALYTGTLGNLITATWGAGAKAGTSSLTIALPGVLAERFDNLAGTGNALAVAAAAAVNSGNGALRLKSALVVATAGAGTTAPAAGASVTLTGGTDGASAVTATTLVGSDGVPRTGMYALRGQGCSTGALADSDTSTTWPTQVAFGLAEGVYMMLTGPSGDTISNAISVKNTTGIDTYTAKLLLGDWIQWLDTANGVVRYVSPQGFALGRLANLSPEQSSLNKPLFGVVGSQKSASGVNTTYSYAELQQLGQAGIDVIANPAPGGNYWALRFGHNTSSNPAVQGDNYTRMTNYIAATLAAGMGTYVGQVINLNLFRQIRATQLSYFAGMLGQGMLALQEDGSLPYAVKCDPDNNPQSRTSLGYVQSDAQVRYQAINEKFIVNLEGGQTVQVATTSGLAA